jgi:hypothetical protein
MNAKPSQSDLILAHLKRGGSITQADAYAPPFNCTRLAARIDDLKRAGVDIVAETIVTTTGKRVARYRLRRADEFVVVEGTNQYALFGAGI